MIPKRGVVRFSKRGKLAPRYIGPFEVHERVVTVAYWLALSPSLLGVYEVFHISMLRKYTPNLAHVVDWGGIVIDIDGTFEEGPVHILDSRDQVLRRNTNEWRRQRGNARTLCRPHILFYLRKVRGLIFGIRITIAYACVCVC